MIFFFSKSDFTSLHHSSYLLKLIDKEIDRNQLYISK